MPTLLVAKTADKPTSERAMTTTSRVTSPPGHNYVSTPVTPIDFHLPQLIDD
jgi:hypothetical protein